MKASVRGLLAAAASTAMIFVPMSAASASETDWSDLTDFWTEYGVAASVQSDLIAGLEDGDLVDALDSTVLPVSVVTLPGDHEQVATFPDGSISVGSVRPDPGAITPFSIGGCSLSSGAGYAAYSNCNISESNGFLTLSFTANYTRYTSGATISAAHTPIVSVAYGNATTPTVSIVRASASGDVPAVATANTYWTSNGGGSETVYMSLRVISSSAWTTTY